MTTPVRVPAEAAGRRAVWLSITALAMAFVLPLAGLLLAVFALVAGIRALPLLKKESKPAGSAVIGITVSAVVLFFAGMATALQFYLADEFTAYQECLKGAGTVASEGECFTEFRQAVGKKLPSDVVRYLQP